VVRLAVTRLLQHSLGARGTNPASNRQQQPKKLRWGLFERGNSMPTDVLLSIEERRVAKKKEAADLRAYLFLIPVIACLFSILLCVESYAFQGALIMLGTE
jgi:hypothetical protein